MISRRPLAVAAIVLSTLPLASCHSFGPTFSSYPSGTVTLTPSIATLPVTATQAFVATAANDPIAPTIVLGYTAYTANVGTLTPGSDSSHVTYTAPATPPIYTTPTNANLISSSMQGRVTIQANLTTSLLGGVSDSQTFAIIAPTVTAGCVPTTLTLAHSATIQLGGYAVGAASNALTWQVNGVTGGSTANGTITPGGVFTAPTAIPMAGPTVSVTAISTADPTKVGTCTMTIT